MTSAPSESGGDSGAESGVSGGSSSRSTDDPKACFLPRGNSAPLRDDDLTVELAVGADANATGIHSSAEPEPGTVLGSRFLLERIIGRGGTSSVYRARDLRPALFSDTITNLVAVKLSRSKQCTELLTPTRLEREFHTMRGLSHPGITRVFELDCDGDMCFMSMQLIAGQTLKTWMTKGGAHPKALKIIDTCCEALEYAHSMGIVHGDLKPTNVLVTDDGTTKLIDFGSSSVPNARAVLGSAPAVAATPLYASPQILAGHRAEPLDDVFSLACLSYGILSGGRHPYGGRPSFEAFRAKSAPTYVPAISIELFEVIERGLSADRDRRPASVSEFRRELTAAEQRRRVKACRSHPVTSDLVQKRFLGPPVLAPAMAEVAGTIVLLKKRLGSSRDLERVKPILISVIALGAAVAGAAVLVSDIESIQSRHTGADRVSDARVETRHAPTIVLKASNPQLAPAPDHTPSLSAEVAPLHRDSSSISFRAAIIHTSARQSLVAITVTREPANKTPGSFVWRVERGNAIPASDYEPIKPRRVNFIEGQKARTLFIPLLNKTTSHVPRGPRFFDVVLQPVAEGPALGRFGRITVVIDPIPAIWVAKSEARSSSLR